jgi:hypothetical protein
MKPSEGYLKVLSEALTEENDESSEDRFEEEVSNFLYNKPLYKISQVRIQDESSFGELFGFCTYISFTHNAISAYPQLFKLNNLENISVTDIRLAGKADELLGYWTAKMESKMAKKDSGRGQKIAEQKRILLFSEELKKLTMEDLDFIPLDKGTFYEMLCKTFVGKEKYPRHASTVKKYKETAERILGKKIVLQKGTFMTQKGTDM